jgi:hypothetical protein
MRKPSTKFTTLSLLDLRLYAGLIIAGPLGANDEIEYLNTPGGELFVEGKEVFRAVPVAGEWLGPVTAVCGAVPVRGLGGEGAGGLDGVDSVRRSSFTW